MLKKFWSWLTGIHYHEHDWEEWQEHRYFVRKETGEIRIVLSRKCKVCGELQLKDVRN